MSGCSSLNWAMPLRSRSDVMSVSAISCAVMATGFTPFLLEKRTVTGPRWANSARNTSPGFTGTILCTAPGQDRRRPP